jgi:Tfp pilus assembly protein PilF
MRLPSRATLPQRSWNWPILDSATPCAASRHYNEAAQSYEQAASIPNVGAELKIRSLLDGGECRDLAGGRAQAVRDYQAAIEAGPDTSRADQARKYLHSPYKGS